MIVKDEKEVIERCLNSIKPYIDHWVIVDTGSTDGTQAIIRKCLSDVPGELFERKWVDFGHNRTEALQLAKGKSDYILLIDADEVFEGTMDRKALIEDAYLAAVQISKQPLISFQRLFLVKDSVDWAWQGVLHEYLVCTQPFRQVIEPSFVIHAESKDGNRSKDDQKYLKDAEVLEKALAKDPHNGHYLFYLAQTYMAAQKNEESLKNYRKYLTLKNRREDFAYWAQLQVGKLEEAVGEKPDLYLQSYSKAFQIRPARAEPLFYLALHFYNQGQALLAYILSEFASQIPLPVNEVIYIEHSVYEYEIKCLRANCALQLKRYDEALEMCLEIEKIPTISPQIRKETENTLAYLRKRIGKD